jgi:preprotein translocase subunit SecB
MHLGGMKRMKSESSSKTEKKMAKRKEIIYPFQCNNILLINSSFSVVTEEELADNAPRKSAFGLALGSEIEKECFSVTLNVKILFQSDLKESKFSGYLLEFGLKAFFINATDSSTEKIEEFIRLYSLSILWPYAREYSSDIFKRAGIKPMHLPIVNPQNIMEDILSHDNYHSIINR